MITTHPISDYDKAVATPGPKHVWIDGETIRVFTGDDIPPPPPPAVEYVEKSVAIAALKAAGKSDAEADAALKTAEGTIAVETKVIE